ncbi:unnamed protein product [Triticum turgidum subsp. durum]|uniref:NB-ARC domain-containing protein n=2 Tax=Triticum TaxID=4564 RepID=A0A9R0YH33_TRITD|nr:unnamed protein product [Triticum turgidum subsp. durum]
MAALNDVDSRRLFFKRTFHSEKSCPPHLEKVSVKILKKCGGLPLAIITIASLLANKPQSTGEWEKLQDSIGTGLSYENDDGGKGMRDILLLSYWDLPHHLKTCLLYVCIYPEDHRINCAELKSKWIAEGFVATQWGNLYQEAENYFNGLVNRNLIQPVDVGYDGIVHYCQVHDMVLDLIISLAEEENFALILNGRVCNSLPSKIHRISIQSSGQEHKGATHEITKSKLHLRSLSVFGEEESIPLLVDFRSLRVLDLLYGGLWRENRHIKNVGSLSQLRYLRLNGEKITKLPDEIGELRYLETLHLRGCRSLTTLPSSMVRLQKLVRLFVYAGLWLPADVFGSMQALEEVSCINHVDNAVKFAEVLGNLTKLRKLTLCCETSHIRGHGRKERFLELLRSSVSKLAEYNLQYLYAPNELVEYMFKDQSRAFPHLQVIKVLEYMKSVPSGMASLNNVVDLDIEVRRFYEEELHLLMGLPSLTHLQLKVIDPEAWARMTAMTVGSNGFKLLKVFCFVFKGFTGTGIAFAPGAMPALRRFHLQWKAKEVMCKYSYSDSADMGIELLSGLEHLQIETDCYDATVAEVEAVEGSIAKAIALHPNRHTLQVHITTRKDDCTIFKDDEERSAAWKEYWAGQALGEY